MIRRLALAASFAVLGAVAFTPKAHGQAAPDEMMVPFEGTVGSVCTLSDPQPGALVQESDSILGTNGDGGVRGSITVNCTGGNEISVGVPEPVDPPRGFSPVNSGATLFEEGADVPFADSEGLTDSVDPGFETVLDVDMFADNGGPLPAGLYQFNVPVTAAPN